MAAEFARVIAVEPSPDTAEALAANIATFGLMNVEIRQVAVGRAAGLVHMVLDAANVARKNTGARHVEPGGQIPCERIDDWQLETLGFLKLDIEGSEPDALEGATETIQRCQPAILYEDKGLWKRFGKKRDAVARLLTRLGYHEIDRCGSDAIWGPR